VRRPEWSWYAAIGIGRSSCGPGAVKPAIGSIQATRDPSEKAIKMPPTPGWTAYKLAAHQRLCPQFSFFRYINGLTRGVKGRSATTRRRRQVTGRMRDQDNFPRLKPLRRASGVRPPDRYRRRARLLSTSTASKATGPASPRRIGLRVHGSAVQKRHNEHRNLSVSGYLACLASKRNHTLMHCRCNRRCAPYVSASQFAPERLIAESVESCPNLWRTMVTWRATCL